MRYFLFILLVSLGGFLPTGCTRHTVALDNESLTGIWKVISYENLETEQVYTRSSPESGMADFTQTDIVVTLEQKGDTIRLKGHTISNEVFGTFLLKAKDSLHGLRFGGTRVGEPHWGSWFWDAMYSASTYRLKKDRLTLVYVLQDNKPGKWEVRFRRQ